MFDYVPDVFRKQYAETEEEADRWYDDPDNNRRPPELLPRDEVARAINSEVKEGRGTEAGGVLLDIASRLPAEQVRKRLPSMYHQFKELADVDITKQPMEVGPTCHYVMGGSRSTPTRTQAVTAGSVRGRRGVGGNARLQPAWRQLAVRPAGVRQARGESRARTSTRRQPHMRVSAPAIDAAVETALAPLTRGEAARNPYSAAARPQQVMGAPGRHHPAGGRAGRSRSGRLASSRSGQEGRRRAAAGATNPGWHLALGPAQTWMIVSECTAKAALEREESRGGHTRGTSRR
jgi:succinate dehydrogenase / fumarate reductase flavoprotein subunit